MIVLTSTAGGWRTAQINYPASGMTSNGHDQHRPGSMETSMETSQPAERAIARSH
jgi:hypothetical protein